MVQSLNRDRGRIVDKDQLREARKALGYSAREAAELYGCSMAAWYRWEHGNRPIPGPIEDWLRYRAMIVQGLDRLALSRDEAETVLRALWGWRPVVGDDPGELWQVMAAEAPEGLSASLVARLRGAGAGEFWALADVLDRAREAGEEPTAELAAEVGLVR